MIKAPKLSNDCFSLPQGINWTPVDDALKLLQQRLNTVVEIETIPVQMSDGRTLASAVKAIISTPPFKNSAVDGLSLIHI